MRHEIPFLIPCSPFIILHFLSLPGRAWVREGFSDINALRYPRRRQRVVRPSVGVAHLNRLADPGQFLYELGLRSIDPAIRKMPVRILAERRVMNAAEEETEVHLKQGR